MSDASTKTYRVRVEQVLTGWITVTASDGPTAKVMARADAQVPGSWTPETNHVTVDKVLERREVWVEERPDGATLTFADAEAEAAFRARP